MCAMCVDHVALAMLARRARDSSASRLRANRQGSHGGSPARWWRIAPAPVPQGRRPSGCFVCTAVNRTTISALHCVHSMTATRNPGLLVALRSTMMPLHLEHVTSTVNVLGSVFFTGLGLHVGQRSAGLPRNCSNVASQSMQVRIFTMRRRSTGAAAGRRYVNRRTSCHRCSLPGRSW